MTSGEALAFGYRTVGDWPVPVVAFRDARRTASLRVMGEVGNSVPTSPRGRQVQQAWKVAVASEVKAARGDQPWDAGDEFAITLAFSFCPELHGGPRQKLDVENFVKPTIDALAAGLLCAPETDPASISHWNYDDSNFNTLLIHRLPDAERREGEGVAIFVSVKPAT